MKAIPNDALNPSLAMKVRPRKLISCDLQHHADEISGQKMSDVGNRLFRIAFMLVRYKGADYFREEAVILYEEEADEYDREKSDAEACQE